MAIVTRIAAHLPSQPAKSLPTLGIGQLGNLTLDNLSMSSLTSLD
jgi:hypothetical protein